MAVYSLIRSYAGFISLQLVILELLDIDQASRCLFQVKFLKRLMELVGTSKKYSWPYVHFIYAIQ